MKHGAVRSQRGKLATALTAGLIAILALGTIALANQQITSAGPLTRILITDQLNCGVSHTGDTSPEFFGDTACGTLLAVGGTLFGPANIPAGGSASPRTAWTQVSQSAVTGTGTAADPFRIVTVADAGTTGLRVTETDTYVVGQEAYRTDVMVANGGTASRNVIVYRAGDCFLQNSDFGFGRVDAATGAVACTASQAANSRIEQWFPLTAGSHFYEAFFGEVWSRIGQQLPFPDTCRCNEFIDNGAGLSWSLTIAAGSSATVSHFTTFSPIGVTPLSTQKNADASTAAAGSTDGYTIMVSNPNASPVTLNSINDTLPAGFSYVAGSTTGATTANPTISAQTLTWAGPFVVPASGNITLHFNVTVASTPGTYFNNAGGDAGNVPVVPTGPAAQITVTQAQQNFSLVLNGSTAYAEAPDAAKLNLAGDWTLEAWFKDETPGGYNHDFSQIIGKIDQNVNGEAPYFIVLGYNTLRAGTRHGSTYDAIEFDLATAGVSANAWHHVAATLMASTRTLTIYLDGVQVAQGTLGALSAGNDLPLDIGRGGTTGKYWNGKIDDVRLWNVTRSAGDISANFMTEYSAAPAGLVANWKFNEGSGTTAGDSGTPPPDNATLNGGATFSTDVHP